MATDQLSIMLSVFLILIKVHCCIKNGYFIFFTVEIALPLWWIHTGPILQVFNSYIPWTNWYFLEYITTQWRIQDFPSGGVDSWGGYVSKILYLATLNMLVYSDCQHWNLQRSSTQLVSTSNKRSSSGEMKKRPEEGDMYRGKNLTPVLDQRVWPVKVIFTPFQAVQWSLISVT